MPSRVQYEELLVHSTGSKCVHLPLNHEPEVSYPLNIQTKYSIEIGTIFGKKNNNNRKSKKLKYYYLSKYRRK